MTADDVCAYVRESSISTCKVLYDHCVCASVHVCVHVDMCYCVCVCVMELTVSLVDLPLSVYTNPATDLGTALK